MGASCLQSMGASRNGHHGQARHNIKLRLVEFDTVIASVHFKEDLGIPGVILFFPSEYQLPAYEQLAEILIIADQILLLGHNITQIVPISLTDQITHPVDNILQALA